MRLIPALFAFVATGALAAAPEIDRPVGTPQANGVMHVLRAIPEACAWLEGTFTGDAKDPYRFAPVRSSPSCQARARLVDPAKAKPSAATGWKLNDVVRVPSKDCPGLMAVVEVWRRPTQSKALDLDAQGRARVYLQDAKADVAKAPSVTLYSAKPALEGKPCG